jgi:hypothetical protein
VIYHRITRDDARQRMPSAAERAQQAFLGGQNIGGAGRVPFGQAKLGGGPFQQRILPGWFGQHQDLADSVSGAGFKDDGDR